MTGDDALQHYQNKDWTAALAAYERLAGAGGDAATDPTIRFALHHCRIELAPAADLAALARPPRQPDATAALAPRMPFLIERAAELCRDGDHARAAALLRSTGSQIDLIDSLYRTSIDPDAGPALPTWSETYNFLVHGGIGALDVERIRETVAGKRLLLIVTQVFPNNAARQREVADTLVLSAMRFGLEVRHIDPLSFRGKLGALVAEIEHTIDDWKPEVIYVINLAVLGWTLRSGDAQQVDIQPQLLDALRRARRQHGSRVVAAYPDAWLASEEHLFGGLGDVVDLVQHHHPTILPDCPPAARERVFCHPFPHAAARPTMAPDAITRFSFVGGISYISLPRLIWWAELGRIGAPVDFFITRSGAEPQRPDEEFANIMAGYMGTIGLAKRISGVPILTGRTVEALLAGGLLIEEASADTPYFMKPGVHYLQFGTLAGLTALLDEIQTDPARRASLRAEGHAWAQRYFSGDVFWAGLLAKAFP